MFLFIRMGANKIRFAIICKVNEKILNQLKNIKSMVKKSKIKTFDKVATLIKNQDELESNKDRNAKSISNALLELIALKNLINVLNLVV